MRVSETGRFRVGVGSEDDVMIVIMLMKKEKKKKTAEFSIPESQSRMAQAASMAVWVSRRQRMFPPLVRTVR